MNRYLIAEMQSTGHHARCVRWILQSPFFRDSKPILAGPKSLFAHSELTDLSGLYTPVEVDIDERTTGMLEDVSSFWSLWRRQVMYRALYQRAVQRARNMGGVNLIVLPYTDHALDAWAVLGTGFGSCPWIGINMQPVFHLSKMPDIVAQQRRDNWIRERLFRRFLRNRKLSTILTIDPAMYEFSRTNLGQAGTDKIVYLPDPSVHYDLQSRRESRSSIGIPEDAYLVVLYGALSLRKGIRQLVRAVGSNRISQNVHILLAGIQDTDVREFLHTRDAVALRSDGRLHIIERYLDDGLERTVLSAADVMWVGYVDFFRMSGILVLAARHGIPSIFTRQGIIGYLGRKLSLGLEVDPHQLDTVIAALVELSGNAVKYAAYLENAKEKLAKHTVSNLQSLISAAAENALGISQVSQKRYMSSGAFDAEV